MPVNVWVHTDSKVFSDRLKTEVWMLRDFRRLWGSWFRNRVEMGYAKRVDPVRLQNLLRLKEQYTVLLLSNTNPFMMDWADSTAFSGDGHPVSYYFHKTYYSYKLKDYKPSATIFQTVLDDAGLRAEETLFLDDGLKNVEAARLVGLHALWVPADEDWMPLLQSELEKQTLHS